MKHLGKFAFGAMALLLASCSSDEPIINGDDTQDGDVYASLTLQLPNGGTRAGNQGIEVGQDNENAVGKIFVVLATKENDKYILLSKATADATNMGAGSTANSLKYTLNFSSKDMAPDALEEGSAVPGQKEVYVFAFCNPTRNLQLVYSQLNKGSEIGNSFNEIEAENAEIWQSGKFLMTNKEISKAVEIPTRDDLIKNHNTPEKALNLGTVKVMRVAARFDFALGGKNNDNKYVIKDALDNNVEIGTVELTEMAMFNIAKNFYYLPRTNSTWDWKGTTTLCGDLEAEYPMSYNVDGFKTKSSLNTSDLTKNYHYPVLSLDGLVWTKIDPASWNNKTEDNPTDWTNTGDVDYRIWRYTSENTIPGTANDQTGVGTQKAGISTGVVFKGEFTPNDTQVWNGNTVYTYKDVVYGDFKALKEYVTKYPETLVAAAFKTVQEFQNVSGDADLTKSLLPDGAKNGFNSYSAVNGKYIMYYYYYNRHNTNDDPAVMGINEFGVVRNNVYKLRVSKIATLGRPDTPKPDEPNEEEKAYFIVSCEVMPWTVRVNNIEF